MMHQFAVVADDDDYMEVNDPIYAAPCKVDDGYYDDGWVPSTDGAPVVTATLPGDGAAVGANVIADFNKPVTGVNQVTMTLRTEAGELVPAVVNMPSAKRAVLNPVANLLPGTTYEARLNEEYIKDFAGQPIEPTAWSFKTAGTPPAPPTVSKTVPASKATGVGIATNVTVTFSKPVRGVSAETMTLTSAAGVLVDAVVTPVSPLAGVTPPTAKVWKLDPKASLARKTTYTVDLVGGTAAIRDSSDEALQSVTWSFTTL
jgi:hypothetical protein